MEQDKYLSLNKRKIHDETEMTAGITFADVSWWPCHGSGLVVTREMGACPSACLHPSPVSVETTELRNVELRDTIRLETLSPRGVLESGQWYSQSPPGL